MHKFPLLRILKNNGFCLECQFILKNFWFEVFNEADCCCSIVKSLEEAINDNHFKVREIFSRKISNKEGKEIPALPVPIDNQFRKGKLKEESPKLGLHNNLFFS